MNKLGKVAVALAMAFSVGAATAWADEPDYYVEWAGFASRKTGPYINTGYVFTKMPLVEVGIASLTCSDNDFFGTDSAANGCFIVDITSDGKGYYYRYGKSGASFTSVGTGPYSLNTKTFNDVVWGWEVLYNGVCVGQGNSVTDADFANNTKPSYIFKARSPFDGTAKISYIRMYNGTNRTELVRNFRPCVKDGVVGFYDSVESKFYANAGSGSFDCGEPVLQPSDVVIDTSSKKFGRPTPDYGRVRGLAAGEQRTFVAPKGVCAVDGSVAKCTGWNLYAYDEKTETFSSEPFLSGTGKSCAYTHPDPAGCVRLEWVWSDVGADDVVTTKAGEWDDPTVWMTGVVPNEEDDVTVMHDVHCSGDVLAKSLVVRNSILRFHASTSYSLEQSTPDAPGDGSFAFDVAEDVTLDGGSLALHGGRETSTITNLNLSIGGDLVLSAKSKMCVAAAAYDGADVSLANLYNTATRLKVGGALTLSDTSVLYTVCDQKVGSPVRIDCESFTLDESAKVIADERGWNWLGGTADSRRPFTTIERNRYTFARGPGHDSARTGGGYGGNGSNSGTVTAPGFGATYGFAYAPFLPGSPSGGDSNYKLNYGETAGGCRGGGVFWLITTGTATLNGLVSATVPKVAWQAASGGSVWIAAKDFVVGENAKIDVSGGDAGASTPTAAGGGGRVSLAIGLLDAQLDALAAGEVPESVIVSDSISAIAVNVFGGTMSSGRAGDGTATTVLARDESGVTITVASSIPVLVTGTDPAYGGWPMTDKTEHAFSAPAYGNHPENATWRYECLGYVVSNATTEVASGKTNAFTFTPNGEDVTVTWLWGVREFGAKLETSEGGHVNINGSLGDEQGMVWTKEGAARVFDAVPDEGHEFLHWAGAMVEDGHESPRLTLDPSEQRAIRAVFRAAAEPTGYTWNGGTGAWDDATQWTPANIPGGKDDVTIAAGTCTIDDFAAAKSLTVSGGTLKTSPTSASGVHNRVRVNVHGDLAVTGEGKFTFGATGGGNTVWNWLEVGGNLTLDDTAEFLFSAGKRATPYTIKTGSGFVNVGGNFTLNGQSVFRPNCSGQNAGTPVVTVGGRFAVAAEAKVDADERGFGMFSEVSPNTGVGDHGDLAAGHGGRGQSGASDAVGNGGATYDYLYAPLWPGQQNRESGSATLVRGGGVVRVKAGSIRVDGTVTANGGACSGGAASGGTIWLVGWTVSLGEGAVVSAAGAYIPGKGNDGLTENGASGGGRISICIGIDEAKYAALLENGNALPKRVRDVTEAYLAACPTATVTAASGVNGVAEGVEACQGTVKVLRGNSGLVLIVR